MGSLTNEVARVFDIPLDFLGRNLTYEANIYADSEDAHWHNNPTAITIEKRKVNYKDTLSLKLAEGGGAAISFLPI